MQSGYGLLPELDGGIRTLEARRLAESTGPRILRPPRKARVLRMTRVSLLIMLRRARRLLRRARGLLPGWWLGGATQAG